MVKGLVFGILAGLAGAAVWAAISHFTGFEIGYLAWGIGLLVGLGFAAGLRGSGSVFTGVLAAVVALGAVTAGKYAAAVWDVDAYVKQNPPPAVSRELVVSFIADDVVEEYRQADRSLDYPPNADTEFPESESDYPADVWAEATARFDALSPQEQQAKTDDVDAFMRQNVAAFREAATADMFKASFSAFDLLWAFFAVATAFRLGAAGSGKPQQAAA